MASEQRMNKFKATYDTIVVETGQLHNETPLEGILLIFLVNKGFFLMHEK